MTHTAEPNVPKSSNRRRRLIVDKSAQGNMILHVSLAPAVALAIATVLISMFCFRLQSEAVAARVQLPSLTPLLITLFGFVAVASLFIMLNAMRISNRVSGPAHNIARAMQRIREGELDFKVVLRDGDQLECLEEEVNKTLEWLREHPPQGDAASAAQGQDAQTEAPRGEPARAGGTSGG